jgi:hypothetical protein
MHVNIKAGLRIGGGRRWKHKILVN